MAGGEARPADEPSWDRPTGLGIEERRTWATWQMAVVAGVALLVGMMVGYSGKKPAKSTSGGTVSLYGPGGSPTTVAGIAAGKPTIDTAVEATPTTATATPTTVAPAGKTSGTEVYLVPATRGTGPETLPSFATDGLWHIGWAFDCVNAPGGQASFTINVVPDNGGGAASPAVQQTSRNGQSVTPMNSTGSRHLQILTDPACRWVVDVTGVR
jgi:hypothetical protein